MLPFLNPRRPTGPPSIPSSHHLQRSIFIDWQISTLIEDCGEVFAVEESVNVLEKNTHMTICAARLKRNMAVAVGEVIYAIAIHALKS